jgi:hypothetical protein
VMAATPKSQSQMGPGCSSASHTHTHKYKLYKPAPKTPPFPPQWPWPSAPSNLQPPASVAAQPQCPVPQPQSPVAKNATCCRLALGQCPGWPQVGFSTPEYVSRGFRQKKSPRWPPGHGLISP